MDSLLSIFLTFDIVIISYMLYKVFDFFHEYFRDIQSEKQVIRERKTLPPPDEL